MKIKTGFSAFSMALLAVMGMFAACGNDDTPPTHDKPVTQEAPRLYAPAFNADSAYKFIEKQVEFGPRVPGSPAHAKTADWLVQKFESYGLKTTVQKAPITTHDNKIYTLKNIIAAYRPELNRRILLSAHWDSRPMAEKDTKDRDKPIDGADDGASGVGVLLEVARQLSISQPGIGVDIVLFDLEDYGKNGDPTGETWGYGSQYWSRNLHEPGYDAQYGILLDMVGAKDATFAREGYSKEYASHVVNKIWSTAKRAGYEYYFVDADIEGITDDHYWVNTIAGIPTADIINVSPVTGSFGSHHHTHADNMSVIDTKTLKAVGQTVLEVVFSEAAAGNAQK